MIKYSLSALAAAGLMAGFATSASAADLGGNCCADLEERIAELEATTARKGNRKVSLTISGWVTQNVMWWDDGNESNVYVTDSGSISIGTHVKFSGQAQISPGWTAGYVLNIEIIDNDSLGVNQFNGGNGGNVFASVQSGGAVSVENSYWFIKSDQLGRASVGKQSSAADNQAIIVDGSGSLVPANYVLYDVNAFVLRANGGYTAFTWGSIADCAPLNNAGGAAGDCDGIPGNFVRYDSPTFGGFSMSASWGEDDMWAISGRYAGEFRDIKLAVAVAYNENTDATNSTSAVLSPSNIEASAFQVGAYIQHVPTGLFLYGAYATEEHDSGFVANDPDGDMWYIKAGIRGRWNPHGATVIYGEYGNDDDKISGALAAQGATGAELERYGVGIVQEIDAAAMSMWIAWRHYEGDITCSDDVAAANQPGRGVVLANDCATSNARVRGLGNVATPTGLVNGNNSLEEFDLFKFGALINF